MAHMNHFVLLHAVDLETVGTVIKTVEKDRRIAVIDYGPIESSRKKIPRKNGFVVRHRLPDGVKSIDFLRKQMKSSGPITLETVELWFTEKGLSKSGASARLTELQSTGHAVRDERGQWKLTPKGQNF